MDPLCFSLAPVWAGNPWMGYECCSWSDLQTQGTPTAEGAAFPLQLHTARGSGHLAYIGAKVWEGIWRCVSQGTKPCCSWGSTNTAGTAASLISPHTIHRATKALKWLKCRNISHHYTTFLRTRDRQVTGRSSALFPFTFPSPIHKICYEGRNHRDPFLTQKEHV